MVRAKTCKDSPSRIEYRHGTLPIHARVIQLRLFRVFWGTLLFNSLNYFCHENL